MGLRWCAHHPVADALERRKGTRAEHELADAGRHFEELRARRMGAEGRMDDHARQDLRLAIDNHGLALEDLAVARLHGQGHVPASWRPVATTRIRVDRF